MKTDPILRELRRIRRDYARSYQRDPEGTRRESERIVAAVTEEVTDPLTGERSLVVSMPRAREYLFGNAAPTARRKRRAVRETTPQKL